jgi:hypothetical protein
VSHASKKVVDGERYNGGVLVVEGSNEVLVRES